MTKSTRDLVLTFIAFILLIGLASKCSSSSDSDSSYQYKKTPVDKLIVKLNNVQNYSIILYDMDAQEGITSDTYMHRYQIIKTINDDITIDSTDWKNVSQEFFMENEKNLGMEIVSKKDGIISKEVSPAGYNNYVGNEKYGNWVKRENGSSFWEFYGKYAMLRSVFHMFSPTPYNSWYNYDNNYRRYGRSYYGAGNYTYGTYGNRSSNSNKKWNKTKGSSFKNRVNSRVSRSSSSSRTSRSSSRYRSSSSFRSRGGGFGK
ncbi:hypothetical protein OAT16_05965 [Prolixibacteraceae bacterium]|nr:hypothetical protein [Prolixibacteraceae bacterium]